MEFRWPLTVPRQPGGVSASLLSPLGLLLKISTPLVSLPGQAGPALRRIGQPSRHSLSRWRPTLSRHLIWSSPPSRHMKSSSPTLGTRHRRAPSSRHPSQTKLAWHREYLAPAEQYADHTNDRARTSRHRGGSSHCRVFDGVPINTSLSPDAGDKETCS